MDRTKAIEEIRKALSGSTLPRAAQAGQVAEVIARNGEYRWVGIYDVRGEEIVALAWTGNDPPAHLQFPVTQGLCGAVVRSGKPVMVGDVAKDPRYLTTFGNTRSEMVVPIPGSAGGATGEVVGLIDAESDRFDAFTGSDAEFLSACAHELRSLWL